MFEGLSLELADVEASHAGIGEEREGEEAIGGRKDRGGGALRAQAGGRTGGKPEIIVTIVGAVNTWAPPRVEATPNMPYRQAQA